MQNEETKKKPAANPRPRANLGTNLKKLAQVYMSTPTFQAQLCKFEQISNWEIRPLRQTQIHYAALDAHVLVQICERMAAEAAKLHYDIDQRGNVEVI